MLVGFTEGGGGGKFSVRCLYVMRSQEVIMLQENFDGVNGIVCFGVRDPERRRRCVTVTVVVRCCGLRCDDDGVSVLLGRVLRLLSGLGCQGG